MQWRLIVISNGCFNLQRRRHLLVHWKGQMLSKKFASFPRGMVVLPYFSPFHLMISTIRQPFACLFYRQCQKFSWEVGPRQAWWKVTLGCFIRGMYNSLWGQGSNSNWIYSTCKTSHGQPNCLCFKIQFFLQTFWQFWLGFDQTHLMQVNPTAVSRDIPCIFDMLLCLAYLVFHLLLMVSMKITQREPFTIILLSGEG